MYEQMTIFDLIKPPDPKDLEALPQDEMVRLVSMATGLDFRYKDDLRGWVAHKGKSVEFTLRYSRYSVDDKRRFISCGWTDRRNGYSGCGSPCDSVSEAIDFFNGFLQKMKREAS